MASDPPTSPPELRSIDLAISRPSRFPVSNVWTRTRVQLGGGLIIGVLLPYAILIVITPQLIHLSLFTVSLAAGSFAIAIGYYLFRSLIAFPGIKASYYILPVFSSTFGAVVTFFFLLRLEYSRPLLVASYVVCVGWYYLVYFMIQRQRSLSVGIVPFGDVMSIRDIEKITWIPLDDPAEIDSHCDAIVADFRADMPGEWERFLADAALRGTPVYHVKQLRESLTGRVELEHLSENSQGLLTPASAYQTIKAVVDLAIALVVLLPLCLVFIVIGVAVRLDSRGPIFFRQARIGFRGRRFRVWKFRTMVPIDQIGDARGHAITQADDKRITRVGRWLRRTRFDELPQIFNILVGEMSWIGPRPEAEILSRWYEAEIPFYRYRHVVHPGISGWAQVNQGHVAELADVNGKLHYDFYYISNFSLWLDVLITIRTIRTMMTGFGSK